VCPPATKEDIQNFQHAMGVCFKAAVDAGLSIAVSPRLDDGYDVVLGAEPVKYLVPFRSLLESCC
jgi:hypothetical protein